MNTTTSLSIQPPVANTSTTAIIFIIVVLLWYSSSIVFLLGMQIGTSSEVFEDSIKRRSRLFVQNFRDESTNNEILSKKQFRN